MKAGTYTTPIEAELRSLQRFTDEALQRTCLALAPRAFELDPENGRRLQAALFEARRRMGPAAGWKGKWRAFMHEFAELAQPQKRDDDLM